MANGDINENCLKLLANIKSEIKKIQTEIRKTTEVARGAILTS